jgi:multisubunit Na+/H+ antiporter MnhF subunit
MKFWLRGIAISVGALALSLAILAILVPTRYESLVNLITTPTVIFQNPSYDRIFQGSSLSVVTFTIIISQISSVILGAITWYSRSKYSFSDLSLVISSLVTTFVFSSPFIGMEWSDRLAGLSFVSLSIAAIIIFGSAENLTQKLPVAILATVTLLSSLPISNFDIKRVFSDQEYSNFKDLASKVEISKNSVIVARHGVEFLSAWEFGTDVVLDTYYGSADLSSYDSVYYIQESKSFAPGIGGGGKDQKFIPPIGGTGQKPTSPPGGMGQKPTPPPGGKGPSDMGGKKDMPMGQPKKVEITGETIYKNDSFTLVKVR